MERRTTGHPILPIDIFADLYEKYGDDTATEILDRVQEGSMTITEAKLLIREDEICICRRV